MVAEDSQRRILFVGSGSAIFREIEKLATMDDFTVFSTYRERKYGDKNQRDYRLNLIDKIEIESVIKNFESLKFDRIIVSTGEMSLGIQDNRQSLDDYYTAHLINTNYLIQKLLPTMKDVANLIYISSIAATKSSFDANYAAVKAGVSAFIRSQSRFVGDRQSIFSVAPSLLSGTRMFEDMEQATLNAHNVRNHGRISTVYEFAEFLWSLKPGSSRIINGHSISAGNEY
jgi:NAD(P)-dependent dehydrogenase (short-subunit alcohol dehydrogenase family)